MWCKGCRQDVPGIAGSKGGEFQCARCSQVIKVGAENQLNPLVSENEIQKAGSFESKHPIDTSIPMLEDDWQLENDLQHLKRISKKIATNNCDLQQQTFLVQNQLNANSTIHSPEMIQPWHSGTLTAPSSSPQESTIKDSPQQVESQGSKLTWAVLLLSVMAMVCGGMLLIWSFLGQRDSLWSIGMPITIAGQAGLLIGLILQMERIWRNSKKASDKIHNVDQQINDLKQTTALLSTNGKTSANSFYTHLSQGASSEILLADLKGQMDLLTMKIAKP